MELADRARFALVALLVSTGGCAAAPPCPAGRACGTVHWAAGTDALTIVPVREIAGVPGLAPGLTSDALPVGPQPVFLRFDLETALEGRRVLRATLSLSPHAAWRARGETVGLRVALVAGPWDTTSVAAGTAPALASGAEARVALPAVRAPVRIDVTAAVRAWQASGSVEAGLGLTADAAGVVFAGDGALEPGDRPRLEVAVQ